jgi:tryptophan-rich sensory protein
MYLNRVLLLVLIVLNVLSPLLIDRISSTAAPWYSPHLLWLLVIALVSAAIVRDTANDP